MKTRWTIRAAAIVLSLVVVTGAAVVAATQGSSDDPLVTLSYLTDVLTPSVLSQVDSKVEASRQTYLDKLNASVDSYTGKMEELLGGQSGGSGTSSAFSVVSLSSGQKLTGSVGCEIMLRVGNAKCVSPSSPGLIDSTGGSVLDNGGTLVKNHLYLFTVEGHSVSASDAVKVLVRGSYTIG